MTNQNQTPTQVSVIIPCYNEVTTIRPLLDALRDQTYPRQAMEVVISDGGSTDGTQAAIKRWQSTHPDLQVTVIVKPSHGIPAALNIALKAAGGTIIVRLDAHSKPNPEYVARSVEALESGKAENVGGVWDIQPGDKGWIARSIASAAGHPIGVGDARYRFTNQAGYVDTVPFGAFCRDLLDRIGFFDETLLTNEDYEFNTRVLQSGGRIWLTLLTRASAQLTWHAPRSVHSPNNTGATVIGRFKCCAAILKRSAGVRRCRPHLWPGYCFWPCSHPSGISPCGPSLLSSVFISSS